MSLQLYQVDYKSYLLDFKSLSSDEPECNLAGETYFKAIMLSLYHSSANVALSFVMLQILAQWHLLRVQGITQWSSSKCVPPLSPNWLANLCCSQNFSALLFHHAINLLFFSLENKNCVYALDLEKMEQCRFYLNGDVDYI